MQWTNKNMLEVHIHIETILLYHSLVVIRNSVIEQWIKDEVWSESLEWVRRFWSLAIENKQKFHFILHSFCGMLCNICM